MIHSVLDVIRAKRAGKRLTGEQIDWTIGAYTRGEIADEQMSALAMAILLRGMDTAETARWTAAMAASGGTLDLAGLKRPTVDKHSTGGVGDKITLALTPLVAACGAAVPQLSGRGLGHTGGTLDKLESIPGWRATLSATEIRTQLDEVGAVVCAATEEIAPADRKLYALRDVTGTVESIPLIAASIMSKKVAEGVDSLVLDVKCGSGAFMRDRAQARELAEVLVDIGTSSGVRTSALLTGMSKPLGRAVGNALEVSEAVEVLRGEGPPDLVELTLALAREMLAAAGLSEKDPSEELASGRAYESWRRMIAAQGGDPDAPLPRATHVETVPAPRTGILAELDAYAVGIAASRLGAGRARKEDRVQPAAGVRCLAKPGEHVIEGRPLLELHTDTPDVVTSAVEALDGACTVQDDACPPTPLVLDVVRPAES